MYKKKKKKKKRNRPQQSLVKRNHESKTKAEGETQFGPKSLRSLRRVSYRLREGVSRTFRGFSLLAMGLS